MANTLGMLAVGITVRLRMKQAKKCYLPFCVHYFIDSNKCQKHWRASNSPVFGYSVWRN